MGNRNRERNYKKINEAVESIELYNYRLKHKKITIDSSTPIENLINLRRYIENIKTSCEEALYIIDLTTKDEMIYE